jgi:hypothetical protein
MPVVSSSNVVTRCSRSQQEGQQRQWCHRLQQFTTTTINITHNSHNDDDHDDINIITTTPNCQYMC